MPENAEEQPIDETSPDVGSPEETDVDETKQDVDKLDFTAEGETFGYISLDQEGGYNGRIVLGDLWGESGDYEELTRRLHPKYDHMEATSDA